MNDIDLSTPYLENWLRWGIESHQCQPILVETLIREVLRERERADMTEQRFNRMMSDMELQRARMRGQEPGKPRYQDGVRYETTQDRPLGPDGFPQRGIV
ncbi:MAG: hypothetical protein AB7L09_02815 [Nitrospira sp.]